MMMIRKIIKIIAERVRVRERESEISGSNLHEGATIILISRSDLVGDISIAISIPIPYQDP